MFLKHQNQVSDKEGKVLSWSYGATAILPLLYRLLKARSSKDIQLEGPAVHTRH